jgi:hypothetical protein
MKWVLKHDVDLESFDGKFHRRDDECARQMDKRWVLQDVNYRRTPCFWCEDPRITCRDSQAAAPTEEKVEWDSDDDNVLDIEHAAQGSQSGSYIGFLGFHPYREVVFLTLELDGAVAYHWNTSKFQYLGRILPKHYPEIAMQAAGIDTYFYFFSANGRSAAYSLR